MLLGGTTLQQHARRLAGKIGHVLRKYRHVALTFAASCIFLTIMGLLGKWNKLLDASGWFCLILVDVAVVLLTTSVMPPDLAMIGCAAILVATRILKLKDAVAGFASDSVLTVMALYPVARAVESSGVLDVVFQKFMGKSKTVRSAVLKVCVFCGIVSPFLNNTPIVALMIPVLQRWSRLSGQSVRSTLLPLSYATILGGICTMIGTSTNLVVEAMAKAQSPSIRFPLFEVGMVGVPCLLIGSAYMTLATRLLPRPRDDGADTHASPSDAASAEQTSVTLLDAEMSPEGTVEASSAAARQSAGRTARSYLVQLRYAARGRRGPDGGEGHGDHIVDSPLSLGCTSIADVRLVNVASDAVSIAGRTNSERDNESISYTAEGDDAYVMTDANRSDEEAELAELARRGLGDGDVLLLECPIESVPLLLGLPHLDLASMPQYGSDMLLTWLGRDERILCEVILGPASPWLGLSFFETDALHVSDGRRSFRVVPLALHRGSTVHWTRTDTVRVTLCVGDVLIVAADPSFVAAFDALTVFPAVRSVKPTNKHASLVPSLNANTPIEVDSGPRGPVREMVITCVLLAGMVAAPMLGAFSLFISALLCTMCFMMLGMLSVKEARESLSVVVYLTIAGAFAVSSALAKTGVARAFAASLVFVFARSGHFGVICALYLSTALITELVTNAAAVAVVFPVAVELSKQQGIPLKAVSYAVMLGGSSSFLTTIGYQTNLMVAEVAQYKTFDLVRYGLGLKVLVALTTAPLVYEFFA